MTESIIDPYMLVSKIKDSIGDENDAQTLVQMNFDSFLLELDQPLNPDSPLQKYIFSKILSLLITYFEHVQNEDQVLKLVQIREGPSH